MIFSFIPLLSGMAAEVDSPSPRCVCSTRSNRSAKPGKENSDPQALLSKMGGLKSMLGGAQMRRYVASGVTTTTRQAQAKHTTITAPAHDNPNPNTHLREHMQFGARLETLSCVLHPSCRWFSGVFG